LVARWLDDEREELWRSVLAASDAVSPADLIKTVLQARRSAQASVNRVYGVDWKGKRRSFRFRGFKEEWAQALPSIKKSLNAKLAKSPTSLTALETAAFLEQVAQDIRNLHRSHFGFADHLGLPGGSKFVLSRKEHPGARRSRVRNLFMQICGDWFKKKLGRPFAETVAALAEIAFPGPGLDRDDAIEAMKIRRPRRTTRMR
jgi:hypothetical protein